MEFINIGKVCGTHGLRGQLKIRLFYSIGNVFDVYQYILIKDTSLVHSFRIENYYRFNNLYIFKLFDLNDIDSSKKYNGFSVILPAAFKIYIKELDEMEQFNELIGYEVFDENNQYTGKLSECYNFKGNIVFEISMGSKYFLINNNNEHILDINSTKKSITVLRSALVEHNI